MLSKTAFDGPDTQRIGQSLHNLCQKCRTPLTQETKVLNYEADFEHRETGNRVLKSRQLPNPTPLESIGVRLIAVAIPANGLTNYGGICQEL